MPPLTGGSRLFRARLSCYRADDDSGRQRKPRPGRRLSKIYSLSSDRLQGADGQSSDLYIWHGSGGRPRALHASPCKGGPSSRIRAALILRRAVKRGLRIGLRNHSSSSVSSTSISSPYEPRAWAVHCAGSPALLIGPARETSGSWVLNLGLDRGRGQSIGESKWRCGYSGSQLVGYHDPGDSSKTSRARSIIQPV